jgi:hypothetical protein
MRSQVSGGHPLLDEGGAVDQDVGVPDIGDGHRIEIAPDRLSADRVDVLVAGR